MYENARLQIGFFERFNLAANLFIRCLKLQMLLFCPLIYILFKEKEDVIN